MTFHVPEKYRLKKEGGGFDTGVFIIPRRGQSAPLKVIVSGSSIWDEVFGSGTTPWEHASVSLPTVCPTWPEMCRVKNLFWDEEDLVVQYHPPKEDYVNMHKYCLHMFRPLGIEMPKPPKIMVGF